MRGLVWVLLLPACAGQPAAPTSPGAAPSSVPAAAPAPSLAAPSASGAEPNVGATAPSANDSAPSASVAAPGSFGGAAPVASVTVGAVTTGREAKPPARMCIAHVDDLSVMHPCTGAPGETPLPPPEKPSRNQRKCLIDAGDGLVVIRPCPK